jgi:transcriptional regulator with XRE-family HTH domain
MDPAYHRQQVGRRLKTAIQALGLSQAAVARELAVSPQKLGNWIRGDHYPDEWFVLRFCNRYGVTTDYLYRGLTPGLQQALAGALFAAEEEAQAASPAAVGPAPGKP